MWNVTWAGAAAVAGLLAGASATPEAPVAHRQLQDSESGGSANSFGVGSGDPCGASGRCFSSPNYPNSNYDSSQSCTITPAQSGPLECTTFYTESGYDRIEMIDGTRYSGHHLSDCPDGVKVTAGIPFTWRTDGSVTHSGFEICMPGPPSAEQCATINAEAQGDPKCAGSRCPLACALTHLPAMASCEESYPDPDFRAQCQAVMDALVDQGSGGASTPASAASCPFAGDGDCDEPSQCVVGTDPDCASSRPDDPRGSNLCATEAACPPQHGTAPERAAWTEILYYDADNNLEMFNVGTLNGLSSQVTLGGSVVVSDAGDGRAVGEYAPLLAAHHSIAGSEVFAQQRESGEFTGLAFFVSHTDDGTRVWALADLGPSLNDIAADWLYCVESDATRPPALGWTAESGQGAPPTVLSAAASGPVSCVGEYINLVVLIDRCRSRTAGCDSSDRHEVIGVIDADGNSVSGIFTGAKRLQLLPPGSAGRWLVLDDSMQPLHNGNTATDPEPDTSVADTLEQFLRTTIAAYPADHYFLEISDHGGAWMGALQDFDNAPASGDMGIMTMDAMTGALGAALGGQKLDIICFDACLMASQTVAAALSSHTHYLIASELSIMVSPSISDPWNHRSHVPYDPFTAGGLTPEEFGIDIVNNFEDCGGVGIMQTMSLVSLDAYPAFSQAMVDVTAFLTDAAAASNELIVTAIQVVNNLDRDYGTFSGHDNDMGSYGADLGAFLTRWAILLDDRLSVEAASAAAAARTARGLYDAMVVHEIHSNNNRDAYTGMHIFFPGHLGRRGNDRDFTTLYQATAVITGDPLDVAWHIFIDTLSGALVPAAQAIMDSGTIDQSGGYTNDMDEEWILTCSDPSATPTLLFSSFQVESTYDYVNVFGGTSSAGQRIIHVSGSSVPDTVHGSSSSLFVQFHTDGSVVHDGFAATFSCPSADVVGGACGGLPVSLVDGGSIDMSGGYTNSLDCSWEVTCSDTSMTAGLTFSAFNTETSYDRVTVYDGASADPYIMDRQLALMSGSSLLPPVHASGPSLFVTFHTDSSVTRDGFAAVSTCSSSGTSTGQPSWRISRAGVENVNGVYHPTTLRTYSGAQTWAKGHIALFRWEHTHWVIGDIGINMDDFTESNWLYTSVSSADTPPTNGWTTAAAGVDPSPSVSLSGVSNPCDGVGVSISDSSDINFTGGYGYHADCTWTLTCSDPTSIAELVFDEMSTESNFDFVTVSDDDSVLLHVSGHAVPEHEVRGSSSSHGLIVHFTSDGSVNDDGFVASFACAPTSAPPSESIIGCTGQPSCDACVHATYSCGFMWGDSCYCEWSSDCNQASWGTGSNTIQVEQCQLHGRSVAELPLNVSTGTHSSTTASTPLKDGTFALTNGAISSGVSGAVHVRADCPDTAVDAIMWTGVVDDDVSSSIHDVGVDTIWLLDDKGGTTQTDTSSVGIWWTSASAASFNFDGATSTTDVHGEWDGLSEVLSQVQPGAGPDRSAFVFSSASTVEKDHTAESKEIMVTSFAVSYYADGMDVPGDGSGGELATLRTSYTRMEDNTFELLSKVLSTQLDHMIEEVVPIDAGGSIVPILFGSKADPGGLPVGTPSMYLYQPFETAMEWGPSLSITREAVLEDFGDGQLVSAKEVVMLQIEAITGQRDQFAAIWDHGVLITDDVGTQDCVELLHRPAGCSDSPEGSHLVALLVCFAVVFLVSVVARVWCCRKSGATSYAGAGDLDRNTSKMRSLSGSNYLELQGEGQAQQATDDTAMNDVPLDDKEQQPMLSGQTSDAPVLQGAV